MTSTAERLRSHVTPGNAEVERRRHVDLSWIPFVAVAAALAPLGYITMMVGFRSYDDEGYFLITVKEYLGGAPLFTQALPIYGPFFYEIMGGLFKVLGIQPSLDSGRMVTLAIWLATSALGGVAVRRLTGSIWIAVAAQLLTFRMLVALANEPMHPAALTALLLCALMVAATYMPVHRRTAAAVMGGIVGALLLVKVNVGLFAGTAVVFAWAASLGGARKVALPAIAVGMTALPAVVMAGSFSEPWAVELALLIALSTAAVGLVAIAGRRGAMPAPSTPWLVAGFGLVVILSLGIAVIGGTHLEAWLRSLLLATKFPEIFAFPPAVTPKKVTWAGLSLAVAIVTCGPLRAISAKPWAGAADILAGLFIWVSLLLLDGYIVAVPLAWVAIHIGDETESRNDYPRLMVSALAVVSALQIYPVAGTQTSVASVSLVAAGALCLSEGVRRLRAVSIPSIAGPIARWTPPVVTALTLAMLLFVGALKTQEYVAFTPLSLPGAESVRVPAATGAQLRALSRNIDQRCAGFITYPGMNSLYFWTRQQPPAELSSEVWFLVLDDSQQQSIVTNLQAKPRLCVVRNSASIAMWVRGRPVPQRALIRWIDESFAPAGSYAGYDLLVENGQ